MNKAVKFLKDCETFYLATNDSGQPRVRPFGAVTCYNNKIYICTNNKKDCFKQMIDNPKVEISAVLDGRWIRLCGEVAADSDVNAKKAMMEDNPVLKSMYSLEDGIFEVLYLLNPSAKICSHTGEPEIINL